MVRRRVVRALFDNPEFVTAEDVSQSEILKSLLKVHIPNSIEYAIVNKKVYACIFEINETNSYVEIHKNHWIQALERCLLWYIEDENYEMCTHIKNIIQSLQEKSKTRKFTTKTKDRGE